MTTLADDVKRYLELLEKQSPIVSTSHLLLGDIYKIWGRDKYLYLFFSKTLFRVYSTTL